MVEEPQLPQATEADIQEPTPERRAELERAYIANRKAKRAPYARVAVRAVGELQWILRERGWLSEGDDSTPERVPDLRGVDLRGARLTGVHLERADLRGALLEGAVLEGAHLNNADLSDEAAGRKRSRDLTVRIFLYVLLLLLFLGQVIFSLIYFFVPAVRQIEVAGGQLDTLPLSLIPGLVILFFLVLVVNVVAVVRTINSGSLGTFSDEVFAALMRVLRRVLTPPSRRDYASSTTGSNRIDLRGANLMGAKLTYRSLVSADLHGANLERANAAYAVLRGADLTEARLNGANVASADLSRAKLSSITVVAAMLLDSQTLLGDVEWADTPRLTRDDARPRIERIAAQRDQSRVYRTIAVALRQQGLSAQAATYRVQEQRAERRALRLEGKPFRFAGSWLLDAVCGYGERPSRIFITYVGVVSIMAAAYWAVTNMPWLRQALAVQSTPLQWYEALVLSLSSFHGRGFLPPFLSLGDPIAIIAAAEAVMGLFIELMLIATFSRRFLGN